MIRLDPSCDRLASAERFGLDLLVDASRLLRVEDSQAPCVRVTVAPRGSEADLQRDEPPFGRAPGEVRIPRALLRLVTDVAGLAAEQRSAARDRHDRVPPAHNPLVAAGRERTPVVSQWARALRRAVRAVAGREGVRLLSPWPDGKRWAAAFTHDLDLVAWWPAATGLRVLELARRGHWRRVGAVMEAAARATLGNPVMAGVRHVLDLERRHDIVSTWFVICGSPTLRTLLARDITYRPEARATREILAVLVAGGHEIGLHGSFATMLDAARFEAERERLHRLVAAPPVGVRQHFLRMRPGATQRAMCDAGFRYDASSGFSDRNGFRIGVADVAPGWDDKSQSAIALDQVPLSWMDRALSKHTGEENPDRWIDDALALASASRDVEGLWVGLWHPNLTAPLGFPGGPAGLERLVTELKADDPFIAPLARLVAWRTARRGIRATRVGADGRLELVASDAWDGELRVEDGDGRTVLSRSWPAAA